VRATLSALLPLLKQRATEPISSRRRNITPGRARSSTISPRERPASGSFIRSRSPRRSATTRHRMPSSPATSASPRCGLRAISR
jgi:hypothetical protein